MEDGDCWTSIGSLAQKVLADVAQAREQKAGASANAQAPEFTGRSGEDAERLPGFHSSISGAVMESAKTVAQQASQTKATTAHMDQLAS